MFSLGYRVHIALPSFRSLSLSAQAETLAIYDTNLDVNVSTVG